MGRVRVGHETLKFSSHFVSNFHPRIVGATSGDTGSSAIEGRLQRRLSMDAEDRNPKFLFLKRPLLSLFVASSSRHHKAVSDGSSAFRMKHTQLCLVSVPCFSKGRPEAVDLSRPPSDLKPVSRDAVFFFFSFFSFLFFSFLFFFFLLFFSLLFLFFFLFFFFFFFFSSFSFLIPSVIYAKACAGVRPSSASSCTRSAAPPPSKRRKWLFFPRCRHSKCLLPKRKKARAEPCRDALSFFEEMRARICAF